MKLLKILASVLAVTALAVSTPAPASPLPYNNTPLDTIQSAVNTIVSSYNSTQTPAAYLSSCSGTTTATCPGLRINVSVTGLTTAASTLSAAMAVTDTSVTAVSQVDCTVNGYTGTGVPVAVNVIPSAGALSFNIQNVSTSAALNATVPVNCKVWN